MPIVGVNRDDKPLGNMLTPFASPLMVKLYIYFFFMIVRIL